jgi:hypothetical protein
MIARLCLMLALSGGLASLPSLADIASVTDHGRHARAPRKTPFVAPHAQPQPPPRRSAAGEPQVDIPHGWRRRNWAPYGEGSCVHASLVMLLHWQGQHDMADWWQDNHHSGQNAEGLARQMEGAGIRFAETRSGDVAFLEWALRTRRGAAVSISPGHMLLVVHLDDQRAGLLDNNDPTHIRWISRAEFLMRWQISLHRWAVTPVYVPPPPPPWRRAAAARSVTRPSVSLCLCASVFQTVPPRAPAPSVT